MSFQGRQLSDRANICVLCGQRLPTKTPTGASAVLELSDVEECGAECPEHRFLICSREPEHPGGHAACGLIAHPAQEWAS